jgi:hypothetical protein
VAGRGKPHGTVPPGPHGAHGNDRSAGAHSPLPSNRIGEILERRKDYRGALEAYTRSLQVEWNQPPIIEAKERIQKLVQ